MAKVKKLTNTAASKITAKELELLQKGQSIKSTLAENLAMIELQKAEIIANLVQVSKELNEHLNKLEFKYGKIQVNIQTGEFKEITEDTGENESDS